MYKLWTEAPTDQRSTKIPLKHAKQILENYLACLELERQLDEQSALFSRMLAKRSSSFRHDLAFKSMCKINAALCRSNRINLKQILKNFISALPDYVPENEFRKSFEYHLGRIVYQYKLQIRVSKCCEHASHLLLKHVERRWLLEPVSIYLGIVATIYEVVNALGRKTEEFFENISALEEYKLLSTSPEMTGNYFATRVAVSKKPKTGSVLNLSELFKSSENGGKGDTQNTKAVVITLPATEQDLNDVGREVDRTSLKELNRIDLEALDTFEKIKQFLKSEGECRKDISNSATRHLSNQEWALLKKKFFSRSNNETVAVKCFRQNFKARNF